MEYERRIAFIVRADRQLELFEIRRQVDEHRVIRHQSQHSMCCGEAERRDARKVLDEGQTEVEQKISLLWEFIVEASGGPWVVPRLLPWANIQPYFDPRVFRRLQLSQRKAICRMLGFLSTCVAYCNAFPERGMADGESTPPLRDVRNPNERRT